MCSTLCDPNDCGMPGFPDLHHHLWSLLKFMPIESVTLPNHLILCHPLLLLPSIFPSMVLKALTWIQFYIHPDKIKGAKIFLCEPKSLRCQIWVIGKDSGAGKDWRQKEKGTVEDNRVGWYYSLNGHEFEQTLRDNEGQGSLACCSSWVVKSKT